MKSYWCRTMWVKFRQDLRKYEWARVCENLKVKNLKDLIVEKSLVIVYQANPSHHISRIPTISMISYSPSPPLSFPTPSWELVTSLPCTPKSPNSMVSVPWKTSLTKPPNLYHPLSSLSNSFRSSSVRTTSSLTHSITSRLRELLWVHK